MLDIKFIVKNTELVKDAIKKKNSLADVDALLQTYEEINRLKFTTEEMAAKVNITSKIIPALQGDEKQKAMLEMKEISGRQKEEKEKLRRLEEKFDRDILGVPNIPDPTSPVGPDASGNVVIRKNGEPKIFEFKPKDHLALGESLDIIDIPRGVKMAGPRNYYLKGAGALLELAVLRFAYDHLIKKGFVPLSVPLLAKEEAFVGTGFFPGGEEQIYRAEKDNFGLIGTSEVALCYYHQDEILEEKDLPIKYMAWSSCFRREAGAAGKDTKGLYRVHQFMKVEQVVICKNDDEISAKEHEALLKNSEEILQALKLPYQIVETCTGDMGVKNVRMWDIETWMPSRDSYGETHSCSKLHDYQARRLNLRYRTGGGKLFCHTLNNTAIASPRILIPILETYQNEDGSVTVPDVLQPYMNGIKRIERRTS